jgi:SAM-dependent methyltransferase
MRPETYAMVSEREERYWWHRARRKMATGLMRRHGLAQGCRAVDLGCGTGGNLSIYSPFAPRSVVGLDVSPIALQHARRKGPSAPLVRADLARPLPFADASVDVVSIFNVLYHRWIEDEIAVLSEVHRILRPGGLLIATEPAFPAFERQMDAAAMTRHRFRIPEFTAMCAKAELPVTFASYFTSFGAPIVLLMKTVYRGSTRPGAAHVQADLKRLNPVLDGLLHAIANAEALAIVRGWRMPFGLTLACVARKHGH